MSIITDSGKGDQWVLKPWGKMPKYHPAGNLLNTRYSVLLNISIDQSPK